MIFGLTDEERAALERVRAARGYRSHAETLRALVRWADEEPEGGPSAVRPSRLGKTAHLLTPADFAREAKSLSVPLAGTFERKPMQKRKKP